MNKNNKEVKIPEELKKKFEIIKSKLDRFKNKLLEKHNKNITGISLLPPKNIEKEIGRTKVEENRELTKDEIEKLKNTISVLVLIADNKKEDQKKLIDEINKIAEDIDKNIDIKISSLNEIEEMCFDGKYDLLQLVAISAILYDPKDVLAALKISEVHKSMSIKKFDKYIVSYVAAGSLFRGEKSNDIDVYIIVDDTDVKKMLRTELKDKLRAIIYTLGYDASAITGIKKSFHIQVYILTDFWESLKDAQPVIFTLLRDGVPLFDKGVFTPWRLLLKMGRIKPSPEAIDMQMDLGDKLLGRIKFKLLSVVSEDLYFATLNPAQAALMLYGVAPPTPKETVKLLEEIFVKKEKLLEKKYVDTLEKVRKYYKDIEHHKVKEIKGEEIDKLVEEVNDYLKRIKKLFKQIEKKKGSGDIIEIHDACINLVKNALTALGVSVTSTNAIQKFKKHLIEEGNLPDNFLKILKRIIKAKQDYKNLTKQEIEKVKKDARFFLRSLLEYLQRSKLMGIDKSKIGVKYGKKIGEVLFLDKIAFVTKDINAKTKEIFKVAIEKNGSFGDMKKSSKSEIENSINKITKIPEKVAIQEKTYNALKKIFGKDTEILIKY